MNRLILGLAAVAALAGAVPAVTTAAVAQPIPAREQNQQDRIVSGVRSGALTPHETRRLETREIRTDRMQARLRERDGGALTRHDRRRVQHALNRDSRAVYRAKHNDRVG